jgi:ribosomal protein S18 acetylase RimI-like enzyme
MLRPLDLPIAEVPVPEGFSLRRWRMESEAEQKAYIAARNECFTEALVTLEEWKFFASAPFWTEGVNMAAVADAEATDDPYPRPAASVLVYFEPGAREANTEFVFTRERYRGRGLAKALMAESLRYLKERGLDAALLEVKAENEGALKVYKDMGYAVIRESQVYLFEV